ncbi:metallophosphoesterase [Candidatus Woesearchaeota archaeon]|nr:metallophosphoesterase [Candidatus Woesearchaeota archaeon]
MEIYKNVEIVDLCLYLKKENILVIGDVHIGYEEALNKRGFMIPRYNYDLLIKKLKEILKQVKPKTIVLMGDLKHEFGSISNQEWRVTLNFLDFLTEKHKVILIKGNHDNILEPILKKRNLEVQDYYKINNFYFCHGHKIPEDNNIKDSKVIIIGHEHPSITFKKRPDEKFKCFLKGKYKNKVLLVLPSFHFISEGSDITIQSPLSPLIKSYKDFEIYVSEDKQILYFGNLKNIASL